MSFTLGPMSNRLMNSIEAEYDATMAAVDADLEAGDPESALARLEEFIQKHAWPEDNLEYLIKDLRLP